MNNHPLVASLCVPIVMSDTNVKNTIQDGWNIRNKNYTKCIGFANDSW